MQVVLAQFSSVFLEHPPPPQNPPPPPVFVRGSVPSSLGTAPGASGSPAPPGAPPPTPGRFLAALEGDQKEDQKKKKDGGPRAPRF